ncbi:MAG TPA: ATP-binding protein [Nitrospiria bacterium]|jgi:two-component system sensor histidine kinase BaeS|nr:ATP-binding protein [Nitrospiria bacterium]
MRTPKISLIWKLVAVNLLGVGIVIFLAWQVIDHFAADYFMDLMKQYNIDPKVLHGMFLHTTHQFLLLSMFLGLGLVLLVSFLMTKQLMRALTQMNKITQKLGRGDYSERVRVTTRDEVGELGQAFNQMVDSLGKIERMRKDLVANVAHELRTPLNNIRGQLEAIQDQLIEPSRETVDSLHEEVLRLVRLVEALHRLSQIDAETQVVTKEQFDLQALVLQLLQKEQARFDRQRIRLKINGAPVAVSADADQMIQVVQNLIQNVLQYTPDGGEAGVDIGIDGGRVEVRFSNSGEGIREEDLPHIFERFYRGEKSRSRESGGAGIGLAIVKQIIEVQGGTVGAHSRPGRTEIWFTLPL